MDKINNIIIKLGKWIDNLIELELKFLANHSSNWLISKIISKKVLDEIKIINLDDGDMIRLDNLWYLTVELDENSSNNYECKKSTWNGVEGVSIPCKFLGDIKGLNLCKYSYPCKFERHKNGKKGIIFLSIQDMVNKVIGNDNLDTSMYRVKKIKRDYGKYIQYK